MRKAKKLIAGINACMYVYWRELVWSRQMCMRREPLQVRWK